MATVATAVTAAPLALPLLVPSVTNIGLAEEWSSLPPLRLKKETAFVGFLVTLSQNKGRSATVSSRTSGTWSALGPPVQLSISPPVCHLLDLCALRKPNPHLPPPPLSPVPNASN